MPKFSAYSKSKLMTANPLLRQLFEEVVKEFDCRVLCGARGEEEQDRAFHSGESKLRFPNSKHNKFPSNAVDVAPYPVNWKDEKRFYFFAGYVKAKAEEMGIKIRWGGDWDSDTQVMDQTFFDLPHFEVVED